MNPALHDIAHALELADSLAKNRFQKRSLLAPPDAPAAIDDGPPTVARSLRAFAGGLTQAALTSILTTTWSTTGRTPAYDVRDYPNYNQPSAGGLGGVDLRVLRARPADTTPPGIYSWDSGQRELLLLRGTDVRPLIERSFPGQPWVADASDVVLLFARLDLLVGKYGLQGLRLAWIQAGVVIGALYGALPDDVGGCAIGAVALAEFEDLPMALPYGSTFAIAFALGKRRS